MWRVGGGALEEVRCVVCASEEKVGFMCESCGGI